MESQGRVLIIAGSDPSGGAGIQADIKTVTALGGYAATAITALTAQNTTGVYGVMDVPPDFVARQIGLVLEDIGADCIKTGMLHTTEIIATVAETLEREAEDIPLVADPVMTAKSGDPLVEPPAVAALRERIVTRATLLTPNLSEAKMLLERDIEGVDAMLQAADDLRALGSAAVLLKGGHARGDILYDVLRDADGFRVFEVERLSTRNTHGTGCTLASAIAAGLARGVPMRDAVAHGLDYLHTAIRLAPGFGKGRGPLCHAHPVLIHAEA